MALAVNFVCAGRIVLFMGRDGGVCRSTWFLHDKLCGGRKGRAVSYREGMWSSKLYNHVSFNAKALCGKYSQATSPDSQDLIYSILASSMQFFEHDTLLSRTQS